MEDNVFKTSVTNTKEDIKASGYNDLEDAAYV